MKHQARLIFILAGGALACSANAANLVTNPDFTAGLGGWDLATENGTIALDAASGAPAAPSLHVVSAASAPDAAAESLCISVDDSTHYDFSMNANAATGLLSASVVVYSDADCSRALDSLDTTVVAANGEWDTYSLSNVALPNGSNSVRIALTASMGSEGEVGDVDFDHIEFGPAGTLGPVNINQEGLTGTWYNPNTSGQGLQIAIFPDDTTPGAGSLFGAWYTYDVTTGATDSQRWYSFDASIDADETSANVTIFQNTGGNFNAPPSTSAVMVGTGTLTFDSCTSGTFTYALNDGRSGTMPVLSLLPNVECVESGTPTNPASDFGLSGAWYNAATSGQGLIVDVNPVDAQVFLGWYTYALNGQASGASGQRWFSAQAPYTVGTTSMDMTVYASAGGVFNSAGPPVVTTPVGTATLTFADCTHATLDYTFTADEFNGQSGSVPLTRLGSQLASCGL